jgi:hypothetical protein
MSVSFILRDGGDVHFLFFSDRPSRRVEQRRLLLSSGVEVLGFHSNIVAFEGHSWILH